MKNRICRRLAAGTLAATMLFGTVGCNKMTGNPERPNETSCREETTIAEEETPTQETTAKEDPTSKPDETKKETAKEAAVTPITDEEKIAYRKSILNMAFQITNAAKQTKEDANENVLISPVSIALALSLTANGAQDATLAEMVELIAGEGVDIGKLNSFLKEYINALPQSEDTKVKVANSIWFRDNGKLMMNSEFCQSAQAIYNAQIMKAAFDQKTVADINQWCSDHTDGMIPQVIDEITPDNVMFIINALVFDGLWSETYEEYQVEKNDFTDANGQALRVDMMRSKESTFLSNDECTGFIKYYKDGYEFIALLPKEGVSVDALLASMNGEKYYSLFENEQYGDVYTLLPKFEYDDEYKLKEILMEMGMETAFNPDYADFTNLAVYEDGPIYIGEVAHKTHIELCETGTKAAAVTIITANFATSVGDIKPYFEVYLNRPFVYIIADAETHLPLFVGTLNSID